MASDVAEPARFVKAAPYWKMEEPQLTYEGARLLRTNHDLFQLSLAETRSLVKLKNQAIRLAEVAKKEFELHPPVSFEITIALSEQEEKEIPRRCCLRPKIVPDYFVTIKCGERELGFNPPDTLLRTVADAFFKLFDIQKRETLYLCFRL